MTVGEFVKACERHPNWNARGTILATLALPGLPRTFPLMVRRAFNSDSDLRTLTPISTRDHLFLAWLTCKPIAKDNG
jgi:hypothetical protein